MKAPAMAKSVQTAKSNNLEYTNSSTLPGYLDVIIESAKLIKVTMTKTQPIPKINDP